MTTSPRIALVDDHPLLMIGLRLELERSGATVATVDPTAGPEEVLAAVVDFAPDCAVVDLGLPFPGGGQALVPDLVARGIRLVILTGEMGRFQWAEALQAGADAVLSKGEDFADIVSAVFSVARGETIRAVERAALLAEQRRRAAEDQQQRLLFDSLTLREREVLSGLMVGRSPKQLADQRFVSVETIRTQIKSLLRKLGCSSQLEAVALAHAADFEPLTEPGTHVP